MFEKEKVMNIINETPLFRAIVDNNYEITEEILKTGDVDVDKIDSDYINAIQLATTRNNLEIIKLLVKYGARVNQRTENIFIVVRNDNFDILKYFLDNGASIKNLHKEEVSIIACAVGCMIEMKKWDGGEMIKLLASKIDDINNEHFNDRLDLLSGIIIQYTMLAGVNKDNTILKTVAYNIIRLLIDLGVNVNTVSNKGITPLDSAISIQSLDFINLLLYEKANCECRLATDRIKQILKNEIDTIPLHASILLQYNGIFKSLVENGEYINGQDNDGKTPLHIAISTDNLEIIKFILSRDDVDLSISDKKGLNVIQYAVSLGKIEILNLLTAKVGGINNLEGEDARSIFRCASLNDNETSRMNMVNKLVQCGVETKFKDGFIAKTAYTILNNFGIAPTITYFDRTDLSVGFDISKPLITFAFVAKLCIDLTFFIYSVRKDPKSYIDSFVDLIDKQFTSMVGFCKK